MFETTGVWLLDSSLGKILIAYLLTLPLGWLREREAHSVGVRTFPIVAMASCGYLLVTKTGTSSDAFTRVLQGLIAGIGFIGGGEHLEYRGDRRRCRSGKVRYRRHSGRAEYPHLALHEAVEAQVECAQ